MSILHTLKQALTLYDQSLQQRHQAAIKRELQNEEDFFYLLCFSELLGIANPLSYYTLELAPHLLTRFHAWHRRMGMERSPLAHLQCC